MKERGMIFNAEMVRAILEGRKTQTRRPVKDVSTDIVEFKNFENHEWEMFFDMPDGRRLSKSWLKRCPFGKVGDRLWVRETWMGWKQTSYEYNEWEPIDKEYQGGLSIQQHHEEWGGPDRIVYKADGKSVGPWTRSIHMPRWASRITLEITDVRVERVQDISYDDAYAEGVERTQGDQLDHFMGFKRGNSIRVFEMGWNSIYNNWDENPWVWVIEFKRID